MKRLVAVLLFVSSVAWAEVSPDVKKYLGSAAALFEKLEYEKALAQLKRAKAKSQGPEDDLKIALYEGIVLSEMGDAGAPAAFTAALGMEPTATLPLVVSPKVQKVFDKAKSQVQKVLDAQAEVDRQKADEKKKQDEANKPPEPVVVVEPAKPPPPPPSTGTVRMLSFVPGGLGLVGVGVGSVLGVMSNSAHSALLSGQPASYAEAQATARNGQTFQTIGYLAIGVGVALVVAAVVMFVVGG